MSEGSAFLWAEQHGEGAFAPSISPDPPTPLSNFIVFRQQGTETGINNIALTAHQQYSFLLIFSSGISPVTFTIVGPGCISLDQDLCGAAVPAFSEWGMIVFGALLGLCGLAASRRMGWRRP